MTVPIIPDEDFDRLLTFSEALPRGYYERVWERAPYGSFAKPFEATPFKTYSREDLADICRTKDREHSWPGDMADDAGVPLIQQQQTNYCWGFSTTGAVMVVRAIEGKPFVLLSASSVCGPASGYRNVGGYIGTAVEQASKGIAPAGQPPDGYPMVTTKNAWTAETKEAAKGFAVTGWADLFDYGTTPKAGRFDRIAAALVNTSQPTPVVFGLNSMSHAMYYRKVVVIKANPLTFGLEIQNSWPPGAGGFDGNSRAVFSEAKGTGDEAVAIWQGM